MTLQVRGESDFPSSTLRVLNCHDAVIYALAPLQYALVSACSDCVVVVGAVGRALRIERCERVQVRGARLRREDWGELGRLWRASPQWRGGVHGGGWSLLP